MNLRSSLGCHALVQCQGVLRFVLSVICGKCKPSAGRSDRGLSRLVLSNLLPRCAPAAHGERRLRAECDRLDFDNCLAFWSLRGDVCCIRLRSLILRLHVLKFVQFKVTEISAWG